MTSRCSHRSLLTACSLLAVGVAFAGIAPAVRAEPGAGSADPSNGESKQQAELQKRHPGAPSGLQKERELPSRYPYNVKDVLRYCKPRSGFWVDLGAGKAQLTLPLIEATDNAVVMIDPDAEAMREGLDRAREKGLEDKLAAIVGVAEQLPLPDESVDLLVSRGSIFFWDDQAKGLREVYRVLRPGGKAMIGGGAGSGYPDWATERLIAGRKAKAQGEEAKKWQHFIDVRRPERMKAWAEAAGLKDYTVMGQGAVSAADPRVGQGVWLLFAKPE